MTDTTAMPESSEAIGGGIPPVLAEFERPSPRRGKIHRTGSRFNFWPVVHRELREESRRPANYWLRVLAAGTVVAVFGASMVGAYVDPSQIGLELYHILERTLLLALWIIVPAMTSDCISRERREGTLGLLFLTPLTALDVIAG